MDSLLLGHPRAIRADDPTHQATSLNSIDAKGRLIRDILPRRVERLVQGAGLSRETVCSTMVIRSMHVPPHRVGLLGCGVAILAGVRDLLAVSTRALANRPPPQKPRSSAVVLRAGTWSVSELRETPWSFT